MYTQGTVIVIDSDGVESYVEVIIPKENEQAFKLAQKNKNWDDYPFPESINVDGVEIPKVQGNLYRDISSGKTYSFILIP